MTERRTGHFFVISPNPVALKAICVKRIKFIPKLYLQQKWSSKNSFLAGMIYGKFPRDYRDLLCEGKATPVELLNFYVPWYRRHFQGCHDRRKVC